jgi:cellulose synthase/poly-beta-1,6-N-acetylglucosamine synthase-like glycosyltransferase
MFFTVQEVLNDYFDSSMCTGTGYVARRKALEDIGGWPLAEAGEDYMCSVLLGDAGWGIAFVRENLQYGLCPESLRALIKQRMRWVIFQILDN